MGERILVFADFYFFGPSDFFADFVAGFFLLIFVGEKVPRKILQNPLKFAQQQSPTHFCRGAGPRCDRVWCDGRSQILGALFQDQGGRTFPDSFQTLSRLFWVPA